MTVPAPHCQNYGTVAQIYTPPPPKKHSVLSRIFLVAVSISLVAIAVMAIAYPGWCLYQSPYNSNFKARTFSPGNYHHSNTTEWCEHNEILYHFSSLEACIEKLDHQKRVARHCWSVGGKVCGIFMGTVVTLILFSYCALITPIPRCKLFNRGRILDMEAYSDD